jgi:hypothetical protein
MIVMIVKYQNGNVWYYVDHVSLTANKSINCNELITQYNKEVEEGTREDIASYVGNCSTEKLPVDIAISNKVFLMAMEQKTEWKDWNDGGNCHSINLIDGDMASNGYPASVVIIYHDYFENRENFKLTALITNEKCFLMNDKGQTIERLV